MDTDPTFQHISSNSHLQEFCDHCANSKFIGFDTEFVSENRYRPELCLLQVATESELAIIDTLSIDDLGPFWEVLTSGDHVTIAHAAREELLFCYRAIGKKPKHLMDVQLAAGFVGYDYPASYGNLVSQLLGEFVSKGETRTDWKRRPLTDRQIQYALGDVDHLAQLCDFLTKSLRKLGRYEWYIEEVENWMDYLIESETSPQWKKISGASRLNRRGLGILQELWEVRDRNAKRQNRSAKRVIPDDLMVELAKRASAKVSNIRSIRGFDSRVNRKLIDQISAAIQTGLDKQDAELPAKLERGKNLNLGLVGQFLSTILGVVCRTKQIAPTLVGTTQDIRNFAAWRMGQVPKKQIPSLATGWRAEVIGEAIDNAIEGRLAIRISNPKSDHPLSIEELE